MPPVELHPEASAEMEESFWWYEGQSPGLGEDFLIDVEGGIAAISDHPTHWPIFKGGTHRYLLRRFPYGIVYQVDNDVIRVLAVMHLRRRPGYWRRRQS